METIFTLLEVQGERSFSNKLNTREDLMKEILKFCPKSFKHKGMIGSSAAEDKDAEDVDAKVDKHKTIAENIKEHVEGIMIDDDGEETCNDDANNETKKDEMSNEK